MTDSILSRREGALAQRLDLLHPAGRVLGDRHDVEHGGAGLLGVFDETEVGVGVEEVLRDGHVGTGLDLGDVGLQVGLRVAVVVAAVAEHHECRAPGDS